MIPLLCFTACALVASGFTIANTDLMSPLDAFPISSIVSLTGGGALLFAASVSSKYEMYVTITYILMLMNPLLVLEYASALGFSDYYWYLWPLSVQGTFLAITGGAALLERFVWKTPRWMWSAFVHIGILLMYYATAAISLYRINANNNYPSRFMYGPVIAFTFGNAMLPLAVLSKNSTVRLTYISCLFLFQQVAFNIALVVNAVGTM